MTDLQGILKEIVQFRDERDWEQFHNPKDLSVALSVEASELLEQFLWKEAGEANQAELRRELADVLIYAMLIAHHYGFDIPVIIGEKLQENR